MWWKKNKWKGIIPVLILAVLVFAFWYGGNSKGLRGWKTDTPAPAPAATEAPMPTPIPELPTPTADPTPVETPKPSAAPAPSPVEPVTPTEPPEVPEEIPEPAPVPEETPKPEPVPDVPENLPAETPAELHCSISISCASVLDHMDWLEPAKTALIPENGWVLGSTDMVFTEGESVFDVLLRVCTEKKIHMEFEETPMYQSAYIEGIYNLYEFDCGELSGWMYSVNGWFPNYGCSRYALSDGDVIRWVYTCELGDDVGGGYSVG